MKSKKENKMMQKIFSRRRSGYSFGEILVVITVIGILLTLAVPLMQNVIDKGKNLKTSYDLNTISNAILQHYADTQIPLGWRRCPDNGVGVRDRSKYLPSVLNVLKTENGAPLVGHMNDLDNHLYYNCHGSEFENPDSAYQLGHGVWLGPYLIEENLTDAWGNPYLIRVSDYTNSNPTLVLSSANESGVIETTDADRKPAIGDLGKAVILLTE